MNYFRIIISVCLLSLSGCQSGYLSTKDTVVPLPTFNQYSTSPVFFKLVSFNDDGLANLDSDITSKLREGVRAYYNARFQEGAAYSNDLILTVDKMDVTKEYIQVGGKNDILSSWKSFDQYVLNSVLNINVICSNSGAENIKKLSISKQVKVPSSYSLYKRDLYLLSTLEQYIESIDKEIMPYISEKILFCR